jgi:hypothetical protein
VGIDDLKKRLSDISRYALQSFDDVLQESVRIPEGQIRSSERSLRELKSQQEEFLAQARVHRQALVDYDAVRMQEARAPGQADPRAVQQSNSLQLQGDAIQRLINLGSQNKDAEFRQELTRKRVAAEVSANALEPQIDRLKRRIEASRKSTLKGDAAASDEVKSLANQIAGRLQEVGDALTRLQKVQTVRFLDDGGVLYRVGTVSAKPSQSIASFLAIPFAVVIALTAGLLFFGSVRRVGRGMT